MISKKMNNEKAISPVIGVILMVVVTALLATVIATFVFGMSNNISPYGHPILNNKNSPEQCTSQNVTCYHFNVGDVLSSEQVLVITNKYMYKEKDGTYSYHANESHGKEFIVDSSIYQNLPLNVSGYGFGKDIQDCDYGFFFTFWNPCKTVSMLMAFHPANFTQNGDVVNEVVIVP